MSLIFSLRSIRFACLRAALVLSVFSAFSVAAPQVWAEKPSAATVSSKISINKADAELLAEVMVGVGIARAEAIVEYRKKNGKFMHIDDLAAVKGIGENTIEKNRSRLTL